MVENKRKKFHDKDKYYRLAKEQGLRSRAAFKLTQINRKYDFLQSASAVLDLCAAPGGWTQVCARTCPKTTRIVAVDILPIRGFQSENITTLIGDITTDQCKSDIRKALQGQKVPVVLCDGAPNIGADYSKDAYEQIELALHAVKCATQHLTPGGTFVTKLYRSRDYASFVWLAQQLFDHVHAFKPKASRVQSAEVFLVCQHYKAPSKIDARLLDPKHVFSSVEGETTGGSSTVVSVLGKQKQKRHRSGYDLEHLDATMRHIESVDSFVTSSNLTHAIQVLSRSTGLEFVCNKCRDNNSKNDDTTDTAVSCNCALYRHHALTTPEIQECVQDLQVLSKADFKGLLTWRTQMIQALASQAEAANDTKPSAKLASDSDEDEDNSDEEEQEIQEEILQLRQRRLREQKRRKKKERAVAAKRRRQAALGMDLNAIDVPEHDKIFSLASITSKGDLEAAAEVNLDQVTDEQLFEDDSDNEDDMLVAGGKQDDDDDADSDDETERLRQREQELDDGYRMYLENTKDGLAKSGTKMAKRSKKLQRIKAMEEAQEDQEMAMTSTAFLGKETKAYAKMLQGPQDSDNDDNDSTDEEDDDGYDADPMTPEEHAQKQRSKKQKVEKNPLIHEFPDEAPSVKTARWFSNPLFASIGQTAQSAVAATAPKDGESSDDDEENDSDNGSEDDTVSEAEVDDNRKKKSKKAPKKIGLDADEVLAMMPKTDKEIRHERRLKAMAREERKKSRRAKKLGETESEFELAPADDSNDDEEKEDDKLEHLSESQRNKVLKARELIKAGMGQIVDADEKNTDIEVVAQGESRPLPVMDDRRYDSENEDYDSDDYAQTLALGTMMLRRSKEKALVDASYNRYAWNDPSGLPEWFVDDENKHYRPQLPIPPALIAKMKEKMMALSAKPIAKVAEARARKNNRARAKLAAAKKQAEQVANSADMSEAMKLKAISKALRGQESRKPGKSYVVAKKGRGDKAPKGVKLVDKRMKNDKRAMDRAEKRKGKKRRHR